MTSHLTCLGLTSSTERGSIALLQKNKVIELASWSQKQQASELITAKIKSGLKKNKVSLNDLTHIAVDKGPGSFTGCRISVNVAKTLAYSLNIPIIPFSSLEIMAFEILKNKKEAEVFALLDAHKSLFYFQSFKKDSKGGLLPQGSIQALSLDQVKKLAPEKGELLLIGNLPKKTFSNLKKNIRFLQERLKVSIPTKVKSHFPQATSLVELVKITPQLSSSTWFELEPAYIRSPDAVEKFNRTASTEVP